MCNLFSTLCLCWRLEEKNKWVGLRKRRERERVRERRRKGKEKKSVKVFFLFFSASLSLSLSPFPPLSCLSTYFFPLKENTSLIELKALKAKAWESGHKEQFRLRCLVFFGGVCAVLQQNHSACATRGTISQRKKANRDNRQLFVRFRDIYLLLTLPYPSG